MKDILGKALEYALELGAAYADVRFSHLETESISVKNGSVLGVGLHVDWEFACSLVNGSGVLLQILI